MGVSGQRHAPAPILHEAGWAPEPVWTEATGKILSPLPAIEPRSPNQCAASLHPQPNTSHKILSKSVLRREYISWCFTISPRICGAVWGHSHITTPITLRPREEGCASVSIQQCQVTKASITFSPSSYMTSVA